MYVWGGVDAEARPGVLGTRKARQMESYDVVSMQWRGAEFVTLVWVGCSLVGCSLVFAFVSLSTFRYGLEYIRASSCSSVVISTRLAASTRDKGFAGTLLGVILFCYRVAYRDTKGAL